MKSGAALKQDKVVFMIDSSLKGDFDGFFKQKTGRLDLIWNCCR